MGLEVRILTEKPSGKPLSYIVIHFLGVSNGQALILLSFLLPFSCEACGLIVKLCLQCTGDALR
jgi:hypothetical protein